MPLTFLGLGFLFLAPDAGARCAAMYSSSGRLTFLLSPSCAAAERLPNLQCMRCLSVSQWLALQATHTSTSILLLPPSAACLQIFSSLLRVLFAHIHICIMSHHRSHESFQCARVCMLSSCCLCQRRQKFGHMWRMNMKGMSS